MFVSGTIGSFKQIEKYIIIHIQNHKSEEDPQQQRLHLLRKVKHVKRGISVLILSSAQQ